MTPVSLTIRDVPAIATGARSFRLDCPHGSAWALVVSDGGSLAESVALQMLELRHGRTTGCRCADDVSAPQNDPSWLQVPA